MVQKKPIHRRAVVKGTLAWRRPGFPACDRGRLLPRMCRASRTSEILIGALGQLTGPFAFIGAPGRDNIQLAMDKINAAGGVNGRKLRLIYEHASTPAESVAAAKKLVENDRVFVLIIASGSTGAAAAADYVRSTRSRPTTRLARRRSSAIHLPATSFTARSRRRA